MKDDVSPDLSQPLVTSIDDNFLISEEVAAKGRMTPGAFNNLRHRGDGPRGIRVGKRILYPEREVLAWLNSRPTTQTTQGPQSPSRARPA